MRPVGLDSLPAGYKRVEYLNSTGTQYIDTGIHLHEDAEMMVEFQDTNTKSDLSFANWLCGARYEGFALMISIWSLNYYVLGYGIRAASRFNYKQGDKQIKDLKTGKHLFVLNRNEYLLDGLKIKEEIEAGTITGTKPTNIYLFAISQNNALLQIGYYKVYRYTYRNETTGERQSFVPCLDPTGAPCMFDLVSKTPFYNAGTGAFIAGLTSKQALNLANLPATGGSLTVSLPLEAAFDEAVQNALNTATARGWTITVQYRESEIATANLEADFLESTGTQYILTGVTLTSNAQFSITSQQLKFRSTPSEFQIGARCTLANTLFIGPTSQQVAWRPDVWHVVGGVNGNYMFTKPPYSNTEKVDIFLNGKQAKVNGEVVNDEDKFEIQADSYNSSDITEAALFGVTRSIPNDVLNCSGCRIWNAEIWSDLNKNVDRNFIPALSISGTPCMYDSVSGQNFYNQGSGSFTVGFDTTEKAAISLSKLPVTTGGTLTVSLPAESKDTATLVPAAIDIAKSRGWTIIEQIRTN
jgi:hypothetical protein